MGSCSPLLIACSLLVSDRSAACNAASRLVCPAPRFPNNFKRLPPVGRPPPTLAAARALVFSLVFSLLFTSGNPGLPHCGARPGPVAVGNHGEAWLLPSFIRVGRGRISNRALVFRKE